MKLLTKSKAEPMPAADALAALLAKISEIKTRRDAQQAELRRIDVIGFVEMPSRQLGREARELLNGAADGLLPPAPTGPAGAEQIRFLRHNIQVADRALEEADRLVGRLQGEAALERLRARADDVKGCMAGIAAAILQLEAALVRRDALLKEIKPPPEFIPAAGWVFLGRVGRSDSQAYRFLQAATAAGWLSEEKFAAAVKQSRAALG